MLKEEVLLRFAPAGEYFLEDDDKSVHKPGVGLLGKTPHQAPSDLTLQNHLAQVRQTDLETYKTASTVEVNSEVATLKVAVSQLKEIETLLSERISEQFGKIRQATPPERSADLVILVICYNCGGVGQY